MTPEFILLAYAYLDKVYIILFRERYQPIDLVDLINEIKIGSIAMETLRRLSGRRERELNKSFKKYLKNPNEDPPQRQITFAEFMGPYFYSVDGSL